MSTAPRQRATSVARDPAGRRLRPAASRLGMSLVEVVVALLVGCLVLVPLLHAVVVLHQASLPGTVRVVERDWQTAPSLEQARAAVEAHALLSEELSRAALANVLGAQTCGRGWSLRAFPSDLRWKTPPPSTAEVLAAGQGSVFEPSQHRDFVVVLLRSDEAGGYAVGCVAQVRCEHEGDWDGWDVRIETREGVRRSYAVAVRSGGDGNSGEVFLPGAGSAVGVSAPPIVLRFPDPAVPSSVASGVRPLSRYFYVLDSLR